MGLTRCQSSRSPLDPFDWYGALAEPTLRQGYFLNLSLNWPARPSKDSCLENLVFFFPLRFFFFLQIIACFLVCEGVAYRANTCCCLLALSDVNSSSREKRETTFYCPKKKSNILEQLFKHYFFFFFFLLFFPFLPLLVDFVVPVCFDTAIGVFCGGQGFGGSGGFGVCSSSSMFLVCGSWLSPGFLIRNR